ncbi:uncharacterized protein F4807DRAFT_467353 [Annulohypoxylon truncatum]|uniref:uncharacterized protein n=1 Tax=Annulohypoxylon truncatum TaxID=327061 RepID=UPI0020084367|nr:uncharacterized protein F4807DRAFT_467353 [Annulohypoxylon truncatum]KAI1210249.1 hypothetical protein F4807DRAFT_467353 [Annulohypoxylon truncatum]
MQYREKFYTETPETIEIYEIHSDSSFDGNETDEDEMDDDEMYEEEMAFDKLKEEQSEIIQTHYDFMCFSIALPLFPQLQQITLYFGDEEQLDDEPQSPTAGSHHLTTLLDVISETKINIKCLTLFNLNLEFFSEKDDAQLQHLFKPVAKLEHLELILDSTNYLLGPTMEDVYTYYQIRTHRGVLRKSVATLTNLRTLNIVLNNPFPFWSTYAMPLNQIVPPNPTWTRLATLKLSGFSCER